MIRTLLIILALGTAACTNTGSSNNSNTKNTATEKENQTENQKTTPCVPESVVADNSSGGCRIRLVSPNSCETIDLSEGKSYEFAWTTDGTNCETPYTIYVGGNPVNTSTQENILSAQLNASEGQISRTGGLVYVNANDLAQLTSSDGYYHWTISSFYGSYPASVKFKVKK